MAELESVLEQRLIDQLCSDDSQWTYRPDLNTEEKLWTNFKHILEHILFKFFYLVTLTLMKGDKVVEPH